MAIVGTLYLCKLIQAFECASACRCRRRRRRRLLHRHYEAASRCRPFK